MTYAKIGVDFVGTVLDALAIYMFISVSSALMRGVRVEHIFVIENLPVCGRMRPIMTATPLRLVVAADGVYSRKGGGEPSEVSE